MQILTRPCPYELKWSLRKTSGRGRIGYHRQGWPVLFSQINNRIKSKRRIIRMCFLVDTYAKLFTRKCTRRHHVSLIRMIPFRYCLRTKVRWSSPLSSRSDSGFLTDSFSHVYSEILQVIMVFIVSYARERILSVPS
jgi:hypothetical protein